MDGGEYSDLMKRLKRLDGKKLDALFHRLHDEESEKIDCLQCANCCRTLGPRFIQNDIARMATHLKMKESAFISQYLRLPLIIDQITALIAFVNVQIPKTALKCEAR